MNSNSTADVSISYTSKANRKEVKEVTMGASSANYFFTHFMQALQLCSFFSDIKEIKSIIITFND